MKITKKIVDRDYYNLRAIYEDISRQFPKLNKWYGLGYKWSKDVKGKEKIDDAFGKVYCYASDFSEHNSPVGEWLELATGHKINVKKYSARVNAALDTLILFEEACKVIQKREQLVGVLATYASRK